MTTPLPRVVTARNNRLNGPEDITPDVGAIDWGTVAVGPTRSPLDVLVAGDSAVRLGYQMSVDYRSLGRAALAKVREQQVEIDRQRDTIIRLREEFAAYRALKCRATTTRVAC